MSGFAITSYEGKTPAIGLLSAQAASITELQTSSIVAPKTTLEINQDRYNLFLKPVENIDGQVVNKLNNISSNKQDIVSAATHANWSSNRQTYESESAARSGAESLFGDTLTSSEGMTLLTMAAATSSATYSAGIAITQIGGAEGVLDITQSTSPGSTFELIVRNVTGSFGIGSVFGPVGVITDCTSIDFVGTGRLYDDEVVLTYYPNLEPPNTSTENPFSPEQLVPLTNSNKGTGVANTSYVNALSNPGDGPVISKNLPAGLVHINSGSLNELGTVYAYSGSNSTVDTAKSNITSKRTEVSDPNNSSDVIKGDKKGYATNVWMISKSDSNLVSRKTAIQTSITILEDPQYGGPY